MQMCPDVSHTHALDLYLQWFVGNSPAVNEHMFCGAGRSQVEMEGEDTSHVIMRQKPHAHSPGSFLQRATDVGNIVIPV